MRPSRPGVYPLLTLTGRTVMRRVKAVNGQLYAVVPGLRWWHPPTMVPVDRVAGTWLVPTVRAQG